jgi:hypothetical protein
MVDVEILGHRVPKGHDVYMLLHGHEIMQTAPWSPIDDNLRSATSRDAKPPASWDLNTITEFLPERWLKPVPSIENENEKRNTPSSDLQYDPGAGPNLQFGAGIRGCFGKKLAYLEMRIVIVLLCWHFVFENCPAELSGNAANQLVFTKPQKCYVKLRRAVEE